MAKKTVSKSLRSSTRLCPKGHVMDLAWNYCHFCSPSPGRPGASRRPGELDQTVVEQVRLPHGGGPSPTPDEAKRRTVVIQEKRRASVVGWLVAVSGPQQGQDFRLCDEQTIVGSAAECHVRLADETVSARHASIRCQGGKFTLTDLDSTNRTKLNGKPVSKAPVTPR